MFRRVAYLLAPALILVTLGGCGLHFLGERREAWRAEAEAACMASRPFRRDDYITQVRSIRDQGVCGLERPLQVAALEDGTVRIGPTATIGCPMTAALEQWLAGSVQPAAVARLGSPVVGIRQMSSYSCRTVNNVRGAELSEHAFGNALDIGGFELADGRVITVEDDWSNGTRAEREFLREVHGSACQYFTTVLGPGYDSNHHDHFHFDLAHHNAAGTSHYCRPTPAIPARPAIVAGAETIPAATPVGDIGALITALTR